MLNKLMLNEFQQKAVEDTEGAVLVFAGAGSGKTRVLTHRIIHLIEDKNVPAWNILAITFTNKATNEMKQRLHDMLGDNEVWVSTFHSLCVKILFRYAEKLGYTSSFSIFDESAVKRVMQRILREKHLEEDKDKDKYRFHISTAKNMGLNSDEYFRHISKTEKDAMLISEVYYRYEEILKENNAMDFDDLLFKCEELLRTDDNVREYYQNKFRYIHVDEFQDTNEIQFKLVKLLSGRWGNVFVVGDDDQSIYGWRGANVRNILDFDKSFLNVKTYVLEQNYRSTQEILDAANNLIKHNKDRSAKELFSAAKGGAKVEYLFGSNDYNEVDNVIDKIMSLKRIHGYTNGDFAVLVRNNSLTRLFEKNFNKLGIPYKVFGGFKFFDRKEVLDVVAYMRLIVNPYDSEALTRVINFPKRGIGDTTVAALTEYAQANGKTLNSVVAEISKINGVSAAVKHKIEVFNDLINDLAAASVDMNIVNFAAYLVNKVGFMESYLSTGKEEDASRWENILEFLRFVEESYKEESAQVGGANEVIELEENGVIDYEENGSNSGLNLASFLQTLALNNENRESDDIESVTIATMHSAKGLEFRAVFIVACEEGILPSSMSMKDNGVEEERRVMYVAMTRARERLYISCVKGVRNRFNRVESTMPSRFISEAKGEEYRVPERTTSRYLEGKYDDYSNPIPRESQMRVNSFNINKVTEQPKKVYNKSADGFVSGAKVKHKKYGMGTVLIVDGSGAGTTVTVVFKDLGMKKFALMNAPLELL